MLMLTCTSCCVLQAVQQDEAWSEAEAASRALPVRNVVPDDVAALSFFNDFFNFPSCFLSNSTFRTTDCIFDISTFWCLFLFSLVFWNNPTLLRGLIFHLSFLWLPVCRWFSVCGDAAVLLASSQTLKHCGNFISLIVLSLRTSTPQTVTIVSVFAR